MCWKPYFKVAELTLVSIVVCTHLQAQAQAQQPPPAETVQHILERLDTLEKQNDALLKEIHDLRQELANTVRPQETQERVEAVEQRTAEQAQTKVSASQKFPIELTGMFLFDATQTKGSGYPGTDTGTGASLRQSIIGLNFYGPHIFGDGQIHGSLAMDFYSGTTDSVLRIRRGVVSFDWKRRSITFGQDKPLISPLQPTSFAHVGIPPLAEAGNLWLWLPQALYEERIPVTDNLQVKAQAEVIQTNETYGMNNYQAANIAPSRPGFEGRVAFERSSNGQPQFSIGIGGHTSQSHAYGHSVPSRVVSADFKYDPKRWLEVSGTFLHGENFGNLGGLSPGITTSEYGAIPVHASAGWLQVAFPVTSRLTFDLYAGRQFNRGSDLNTSDPFRSLMYAGNILYRIAPNVVLGFEGGENEITYWNAVPYSGHRFDATVAYLF